MNIEIHDARLEAKLQQRVEASGGNAEDVLARLLETQEEQDRWLSENREAIRAQIRRGLEELDRGEGIPEGALDENLARLKAE